MMLDLKFGPQGLFPPTLSVVPKRRSFILPSFNFNDLSISITSQYSDLYINLLTRAPEVRHPRFATPFLIGETACGHDGSSHIAENLSQIVSFRSSTKPTSQCHQDHHLQSPEVLSPIPVDSLWHLPHFLFLGI